MPGFGFGYGFGLTRGTSTPSPPPLDADAVAYADAEGITDEAIILALSNWFIGLKALDVYDNCIIMRPFVGSSSAQCELNAVNPVNSDAVFHGGITFTVAGGAKPNGSSGYAEQFISINDIKATGFTFMYYSLTQDISQDNGTAMWGVDEGAYSHWHSPYYKFGGEEGLARIGANANTIQYANSTTQGMFTVKCGDLTSANYLQIRKNQTQVFNASINPYVGSLANDIYLFALNLVGVGVFAHTPLGCGMFLLFNRNLTDLETDTIEDLNTTFQTAIDAI